MGYTKNPNILTYYAVKGEAKFTGLFYPFFSESEGITLTAYAAAKPFGGRIGPKFFKSTSDKFTTNAHAQSSDLRIKDRNPL